jgi:hypothetical protein
MLEVRETQRCLKKQSSLVVGYTGRRGSGKTTAMTLDAYNYFINGFKVYTNMKSLVFASCLPENNILSMADSDELNDCVVVIDEIQVLFDSRRSARRQNVNFLYFIQQIRKRNVSLLYTTQFSRRVDIGIREHTDLEARPRIVLRKGEYYICDVTYEDIVTTIETGVPTYFRKVFVANDVFDLFDTNEKAQEIKPIEEKKTIRKVNK